MRRHTVVAIVMVFASWLGASLVCAGPLCAQVGADGKIGAADTTGAVYRDAVARLKPVVAANTSDAAARRELVRALTELGEYAEAEHVATAGGNAFARMVGDAQLAQGKIDPALASYQRAVDAHAADSASARLGVALIHYGRGDRANAVRELEWFIGFYNSAARPTDDELTAIGQAVATLGVTDPQLFHDAVKAFEEAARQDPKSVDAKILEGAVFLDKFDSRNGTPVIAEALAIEPTNPRALVQLARAKRFDGSDEAIVLVSRAISINPDLVSARVLKAELLAASEDYATARKEAEQALAVNPASVEAIAVLAGIEYVQTNRSAYSALLARARALNPIDTKVLTKVSEMAAAERRFVESVELARAAVAVDSTDWDAMTLAGLGAFRIGRFDEAARTLAIAFKGDPYNPWVKNTLDLLDTYPQYATEETPRFNLVLNRSESDLIALYMRPLAEAAFDTLSARYKWKPDDRIRIEVYPRHGDFSVRTVGLAGLGALGVSFGDILAMDSPSARKIGEFHWASTMWHEVAHTFTLGLSHMKIPRWLTEGISGWEEARAHTGWGDPLTPSFLSAYAGGKVPPLSKITAAFIRPSYPEQTIHAYAMAELVVDEIATTRGVDALRKMVAGFGEGKTQAQVISDVLHATPEQFDAEFDAYMKKRFASQFAAIQGGAGSPYAVAMAAGRAAAEADDVDGAVREFDKARVLFPDYAGPGSPYEMIAQIEMKRGNDAAAIIWLDRITQRYAQNYEAWIELSKLREKTGDQKGAAAALVQAMYVHPYDPVAHDRLATLLTSTGKLKEAVRERRAIVALKPVDKASAYYQLALALEAAGDRAGARSEVLRALETAPGYAPAQELLLRLQAAK